MREVKGDLHEALFFVLFDNFYQFKTSELKNVEKLVKQTIQALKPCQNGLGMCSFVQSVELYLWYRV